MIWIAEEDLSAVDRALDAGKIVFLALPEPANEKKVKGPSTEFLEQVRACCQVLLVEADGSRRRPVKIPRAWEPAIPAGTDLTVAVLGLTGIGQTINVCGYVPDDLAAFLDHPADSVLTQEDVVRIVSSEQGLRKSAVGDYAVVLNQADNRERKQAAEWIIRELDRQGIRALSTRRQSKISLILLAAGLGRRFGGEKIFAVTPQGKTFLETALDRCEELAVDERILVYRHEEVEEVLHGRKKNWIAVKNDEPELGISHSLQLGMAASGETDGWMFCVCDQPKLTAAYMEEMIRVWKREDVDVVSAVSRGIPGNPKIFSLFLKEELEALTGDTGGREIFLRHPDRLRYVEASDPNELVDVDVPGNFFLHS